MTFLNHGMTIPIHGVTKDLLDFLWRILKTIETEKVVSRQTFSEVENKVKQSDQNTKRKEEGPSNPINTKFGGCGTFFTEF